jgi:hypothetical protein
VLLALLQTHIMEIVAHVINNYKTNSDMNCQNCQSKLSCGCQKRIATDGREVCSSCVTTYENSLIKKKQAVDEQLKLAAMNAASQNNK